MIIYLHGFSSAAASHKATVLREAFSQYNFLVPDYPSHQPSASISFLSDYIKEKTRELNDEPLMLMGSSLGGYYAQYLGVHPGVISKLVLINPALQPQITLQPYIGQQTNMVTGAAFIFSQQNYNELAQFEVSAEDIIAPTLVLLDEGDEIIDYRFAEELYKNSARVIVYPGGSHWFDHMDEAIPEIASFYRRGET
ncbi:YqiA/YcfP family alpha/beta fold hydrolase [Kaarinaea lacus]